MIIKSLSVVFSALVLVSFLDAHPADARTKAKPRVPGAQLASLPLGNGTHPAANGAHNDAMAQCESQYGGQRVFLGRDRYAYIEQCFHMATGRYPHQVQMNCRIQGC